MYIFISLGSMPSSGIAGSYNNPTPNIIKNFQTVFQNGSIILYSHKQCVKVKVSLCSCQYLLLSGHLCYFTYPSDGFDLHFFDG